MKFSCITAGDCIDRILVNRRYVQFEELIIFRYYIVRPRSSRQQPALRFLFGQAEPVVLLVIGLILIKGHSRSLWLLIISIFSICRVPAIYCI